MKLNGWRAALQLAGVLFLAACLGPDEPSLQGPGTEVVGRAEYSDGKPADSALVVARPADYLMDDSPRGPGARPGGSVYTDGAGKYRLNLVPGRYSIEVRGTGKSALVCVNVDAGRKIQEAPTAKLRQVGGLRGEVIRPLAPETYVLAQIRGLDRRAFAQAETGDFLFSDLPPGRYSIRLTALAPSQGVLDLDGIEVNSDSIRDLGEVAVDTAAEDYSTWSHARRIFIRTGAAGAGMQATVTDFPLAVKLEADNFPFDSSVSPTGSDLRFANAAGVHLPYEIENWNRAGRQATIWVRVDTIRGNDDAQFIRMYWGKSNAPDLSLGRNVFGSERGFRHVWHLHEDPRNGSPLLDATAGGGMFTAPDPVASDNAAPVFRGISLDGVGGHLAGAPLAGGPASYTLSLWFQASTDGPLLGFENAFAGNGSTLTDRYLWLLPQGYVQFAVLDSGAAGSGPHVQTLASPKGGYFNANRRDWHHVAATLSPAGEMSLYLDGVFAIREPLLVRNYPFDGYWIAGKGKSPCGCPNNDLRHLRGALDEIRIETIVQSPEWIRLSYENQKPLSNVIRVEP